MEKNIENLVKALESDEEFKALGSVDEEVKEILKQMARGEINPDDASALLAEKMNK